MSHELLTTPLLPLPTGTQVVTRTDVAPPDGASRILSGTVGVVVAAPQDGAGSYQVRFPDGSMVSLHRHELAIRKQVQKGDMAFSATPRFTADLYASIIYRCVVGSRAYGLDQAGSDTDRRGIFLPPAELHWSLAGTSEQLENNATEECYWELQKFMTLALRANPNVLECLYTPLVELATPLAEELLAMRGIFLSQLIYQTYNGYVMSQFKKLEADLRNTGALKWKHVMHLIRLLWSGITALREGFVPVRIEEHREQLLRIRRGEMPWDDINAWRLRLHAEFDAAAATSRLPERPDYEQANAFLVRARRSMVEGS